MSTKEADDFLNRVNLISQSVSALKDGTMSIEEADKLAKKMVPKEEKERLAREQKLKEEMEQWKVGRPGKGEKEDYDWFCNFCFLEFKEGTLNDKKECVKCNQALIPQAARKRAIMDKVHLMAEEKHRREQRRARYKNWQANPNKNKKKASTDYDAWEFFEPETTEDSDADIPTPNDPAFHAMEADIMKRNAVRAEKQKRCEAAKANGNAAFAKKQYDEALAFYTIATQERKDNKFVYSNRALTYLCKHQYKKALKDCNTAFDIFEFLEDGMENLHNDDKRKFALKVFLRRASAYRGLKDYENAKSDLDEADKAEPNNKEVAKLRSQIEADIAEAEKAAEIMKETLQREKEEKAAAAAKAMAEAQRKEDNAVDADIKTEEKSAPKPSKSNSKKGKGMKSGNAFDRMTAALSDLRNINTAIQEEVEKALCGDDENAKSAKKPTKPYSKNKISSHLSTLSSVLSDVTTKEENMIFFREKKGIITVFKLLRYFASEPQSPELVFLMNACLKVFAEACDNDHSKEAFVKLDGLQLVQSILKDNTKDTDLQVACLQVLSLLSEHISARNVIGNSSSASYLAISSALSTEAAGAELARSHALCYLCNCTYEPKFRKLLRGVSPNVFTILAPFVSGKNIDLASKALGCLGNITTDKQLRKTLVANEAVVHTVINSLEPLLVDHRAALGKGQHSRSVEIRISKLLGVLMNLAVDDDYVYNYLLDAPSPISPKKTMADSVFTDLVFLVYHPKVLCQLRERSIGILSRFCRHQRIREIICSNGGIEAMLLILCSPITAAYETGNQLSATSDDSDGFTPLSHEHAIRGLALCAKENPKVCSKICKFSGTKGESKVTGVDLILACLQSDSKQLSGNAALLVSSCAVDGTLLTMFRAFVPTLIKLMKDDSNPSAQQNAAIASAKLAKDPQSLQQIREMRGLEIMHHVTTKMKMR